MIKKNNRAFTLVELIMVIAIVGILASVTIASLGNSRQKADDAKRAQDLQQVKTALELYAEKNQYVLPQLAQGTSSIFAKEQEQSFAMSLFVKTAHAQVTHTEPACVAFDQLGTLLVNAGYMPQVPRDPRDAATDTCYKAYSIDADSDPTTIEAIAAYTLLWEKYQTPTDGVYGNKKAGFIVSGKTEVNPNLMSVTCTVTGEYPVFDLSSTSSLCTRNPSDTVADIVLGVTRGSEYASGVSSPSDVSSSSNGTCSISQYTNEADCIAQRSYCSDNTYLNETDCTSNGVTSGASCSNLVYTDEFSCTSNGTYSGGSCSGGSGYPDESSCINAGYYSPSNGCSNSSYTDESSCTNASCVTAPGSCTNGSYSDQSSCTGAQCLSTSGYCSDYSSTDELTCTSNGYTWTPDQYTSCGYSWTPDQYANCGYTWTTGTWYSYMYTWYPGTLVPNTWYPGNFTPHTWTAISPGVWTVAP